MGGAQDERPAVRSHPGQAQPKFFGIQDAIVFGFGLPPILGLGTAGGFEFMLEDRAGGDIAQLADVADKS